MAFVWATQEGSVLAIRRFGWFACRAPWAGAVIRPPAANVATVVARISAVLLLLMCFHPVENGQVW